MPLACGASQPLIPILFFDPTHKSSMPTSSEVSLDAAGPKFPRGSTFSEDYLRPVFTGIAMSCLSKSALHHSSVTNCLCNKITFTWCSPVFFFMGSLAGLEPIWRDRRPARPIRKLLGMTGSPPSSFCLRGWSCRVSSADSKYFCIAPWEHKEVFLRLPDQLLDKENLCRCICCIQSS